MTRKTAGIRRLLLPIGAVIGVALVAGCSGSTHQEGNPGSAAGAAGVNLGSAGASGALSAGGGSGGRAGAGGAVNGGAAATDRGGAGGNEAGGSAGRVGTGGMAATAGGGGMSSGGGANCIVGAECKCADLTGVIQCGASGPNCVCPPAEQCQTVDDPKCFVPCGGDPFGGWVLEGSCYAGSSYNNGVCDTFTQATPGQTKFRMRLLDGGDLDCVFQAS